MIRALTYGSCVPSSTTSSIDTPRNARGRCADPSSKHCQPWKFTKFFDGYGRAIGDFFRAEAIATERFALLIGERKHEPIHLEGRERTVIDCDDGLDGA
jgi:hypothetical protein